MEDSKVSYLQMIQNVITRMAENSFKIKGWAIGVMLAIFSFAGTQGDKICILFTVVPLLVLWCLDTYIYNLKENIDCFIMLNAKMSKMIDCLI